MIKILIEQIALQYVYLVKSITCTLGNVEFYIYVAKHKFST